MGTERDFTRMKKIIWSGRRTSEKDVRRKKKASKKVMSESGIVPDDEESLTLSGKYRASMRCALMCNILGGILSD